MQLETLIDEVRFKHYDSAQVTVTAVVGALTTLLSEVSLPAAITSADHVSQHPCLPLRLIGSSAAAAESTVAQVGGSKGGKAVKGAKAAPAAAASGAGMTTLQWESPSDVFAFGSFQTQSMIKVRRELAYMCIVLLCAYLGLCSVLSLSP